MRKNFGTYSYRGLYFAVILLLSGTNALQAEPAVPPQNNVQGDLIRTLPALPRTNQAEGVKKEAIEVAKPSIVGGPAPAVKTIRLSGFESEIEKDIEGYQLVSKYFPMQLTQSDWKRVSEEIWEGYRDMGKLVRVDLVADHDEFIVSISLLRIRKVDVRSSTASDASIDDDALRKIAKLARKYVVEGQVADLFALKKFLLHMDYRANEVITTQVTSANGEAVDVTFIVSKRSKKALTPWQIGADNYGLTGFGKYRFTGRYSAPLFSAGDNFALQTLLSEGQEFGSARYDFPIGYLPLRGSIWASLLHYKVDSQTPQDGRAKMAGIDFSYPIFFRGGGLVTASTGYEFKGTNDYLHQARNSLLFTQKWINNFHLRASGENFMMGRLSFSGDLTLGNLYIGGDGITAAFDGALAKTQGNFTKFYWEGNFTQPVTVRSSVALSLKGQYANKNLDSLEKFSFGGVNGVRAYNSDIGTGDEGVLANLSYSMLLNTPLPTRVGVFYDHAFVRVNQSPWQGEFDGLEYGNNYQLNAAGLQLTTGYKGLLLNATVAYPVNKKPVDPNQKWRLWAQIAYSF